MNSNFVEELTKRVRDTIEEYRMFENTKKAVIGFSAGPDSVCLLDVLKRIYGDTIDFFLVYINHRLRPQNILKKEERLTRDYAQNYGCRYRIIKIEVPKTRKGLEGEARERRYNALLNYAKKISASRIVLGHNLDDVVETFFLNLVRGSGTLGLQSIPAVRLPFVRPLINIKKDVILRYLKKRGLNFAIDTTNLDTDIRRNLIRKKIIPHLVKLNPQLHYVIKREIEILHTDEEYFQSLIQKIFDKFVEKKGNGLAIDIRRLMYYNKAIRNRVLMNMIIYLKNDRTGFESKHIEAILGLKNKQSGKRIALPDNLYAQRVYGKLFIGYAGKEERKNFFIPLKIGEEIEISNLRLKTELVKNFDLTNLPENIEVFDFEGLKPPLLLRNWKSGDKIKIRDGTKRIKEVLNEAKVPVNQRVNTVLFCDQKGVLWVIGIRRAYRAFINKKTKNILKVEFEYLD